MVEKVGVPERRQGPSCSSLMPSPRASHEPKSMHHSQPTIAPAFNSISVFSFLGARLAPPKASSRAP